VLYHYTNLQGLLGIIENKNIWASHCEYLNDSSEFQHAIDFARTFSSNIFMEDEYLGAFGFSLERALSKIDRDEVYVSSFSEKADLLSQWRGYCEPSMGICIGFKKEIIENFCESNKYILRKCLYDHVEQEKLINSLVSRCLINCPQPVLSRTEYNQLEDKFQFEHSSNYSEYITDGEGKERANLAFNSFCRAILEYAPFMKNNGFHEEAEWRIIYKNPKKDIKYRTVQSHLTPYVELPLLSFSNEAISEIIIGPNPNSSKCINSVKRLLLTNNLSKVNISSSKIPFSSW